MEKYYYKFVYNNNYISQFYAVNENQQYDFYGQMGEFPDVMASLPEGWYKFENNNFVLDQVRKQEIIQQRNSKAQKPTWEETIDAQVTYTAMMTDTLLEE